MPMAWKMTVIGKVVRLGDVCLEMRAQAGQKN